MDVGVAPGDHVPDDSGERLRIEPVAVDAPAHACQRRDGGRMADGDRLALRDAEKVPGRLGKPGLIEGEERVPFDLEQRRLDMPLAIGKQNL